MYKSVLPGWLYATENESKTEASNFKWCLSSLQKDLLLKSLGILLDTLLLSLDKAYLVPKRKSFTSLFHWASYLLRTEQGLGFSLVPGMCLHARLSFRFACPLNEESSQEDQGDKWSGPQTQRQQTSQGPNLASSNVKGLAVLCVFLSRLTVGWNGPFFCAHLVWGTVPKSGSCMPKS